MLPNKMCQWQNLLGCDHWAPTRYPESKMVRFCDLVRVVIGPLSKKTSSSYVLHIYFCSELFRVPQIIFCLFFTAFNILKSQNQPKNFVLLNQNESRKTEISWQILKTQIGTLVRNLWFLFPLALILSLSSRHEKVIK